MFTFVLNLTGLESEALGNVEQNDVNGFDDFTGATETTQEAVLTNGMPYKNF